MSTPIKFLKLTIRNFMSYGNNETEINLDFKEPVLIVGKNNDAVVNGQVDSNGAGKSAILDALAYALYDKTISKKEKKGDLINNINKKNLQVSLTFEKNGLTYVITRILKTKTKADVQLLIENKDGIMEDKTPDSIINTNKKVEEIVGLPFDVFARIIVFSANFKPFLDLPSRHQSQASQTEIMEELFGYTELTEKAESLKEKIKGVKAEFNNIEQLQQQVDKEKERHATQLESAKARMVSWDNEQKKKIQEATTKLEKLNEINLEEITGLIQRKEDKEKKLEQVSTDLKIAKSEKQNLQNTLNTNTNATKNFNKAKDKIELIEKRVDFDKEDSILEKINDLTNSLLEPSSMIEPALQKIKEHTKNIEKLTDERESLKNEICPYCKQEMHNVEENISEINDKINELQKEVKKLETTIEDARATVSKIEKEISNCKEESVTKGSQSDLQKIKDQYNSNKTIVESYTENNDPNIDLRLDEKIEEVEELDQKRGDLVMELESLDGLLTSINDISSVDRIKTQREHLSEDIKKMESEENPHNEVYDELLKVKFDEDYSKKLNELENELRHQDFLLKLLTKKDSFVRKSLLDRSLPFLNKRLMIYLESLGLPHRVEFEADMSAKISQFGTELGFGDLSSGQRARVNIALAFAFRDVLQAKHGKISFCMLDECLDTGLGNVGVQLAAKMIKKIAEEEKMSMFVISHRDEIASMFDKKLVVELENGFSRIVDQAA